MLWRSRMPQFLDTAYSAPLSIRREKLPLHEEFLVVVIVVARVVFREETAAVMEAAILQVTSDLVTIPLKSPVSVLADKNYTETDAHVPKA